MKIEILELQSQTDEETIQKWIDDSPPVSIKFVTLQGNYIYIFYDEQI